MFRNFTRSSKAFLAFTLLYSAMIFGIPAPPSSWPPLWPKTTPATVEETRARFDTINKEVGTARNAPEMMDLSLEEEEVAWMSKWGETHWDFYRHAIETMDINRGVDYMAEGIDDILPILESMPDVSESVISSAGWETLSASSSSGSWNYVAGEAWEFTSDTGSVVRLALEDFPAAAGEVVEPILPVIEAIPGANSLIPGADVAANTVRAQQMLELEEICNAMFGETVQIPAAVVEDVAVIAADGVITGAGVGVEGADVAISVAGVEAAMAASEGAIEGSIVVTEAGLLASGAVTLGITVAIAAVVAAAGFLVMPLISALKDDRETVNLHGFVMDIDGDGKPEKVNDFMSKLTPNNTFLYHRTSGIQGFFNHLFKKKEKMTFDFTDEVLGHVNFAWKGDAFAGQTAVLGVLENMSLSAEDKAIKILDILAAPNHAGNKKHDKIKIDADMDHDGKEEHLEIKYKGRNIHDGKLEIEGDIDGDGKEEECEWHDDKNKGCKESDSESDSD